MQAFAKEQTYEFGADTLNGDFDYFYHEYYPRVHQYVRYRIANKHDTDDITSQIFLKIYEKRSLYCSEAAPLYGWVFCIARNLVIDYCRRNAHWKTVTYEDAAVTSELDPEEIIMTDELKQSIRSGLHLLNERERTLILLRFWQGKSNKEIAKITGLSDSNVGVIFYRTMKQLRHIMESRDINSETVVDVL